MPAVKVALGAGPVQAVANKLLDRRSAGPDVRARKADRWAILAEARSADTWRNIALLGADVYGVTAETLATGALKLAHEGHDDAGVMAPVQAMGIETLQKELIDFGVEIQTYEPA
ncbi:MAG: hypothetical protein QOG16_93 [Actinomycetota bacterium]|nr:hypothetical protein [Actinomycetota bacterium]